MKTLLKATLAGAIAAAVFSALLRRLVAQQAEAFHRLTVPERVPTVNPIIDAEPDMEEPVQDLDSRVAPNAPF